MRTRFLSLIAFALLICCWLISATCFAAPFNIVPKSGTPLPTQVVSGNNVNAFYVVTNTTGSRHTGNYVKTLPPNVTQITDNSAFPNLCGKTFNLNTNASCILELNVSGAVQANDPNPNHHLFVCLGGCTVCCAGTLFPLNVKTVNGAVLLSISISPLDDTMPIDATKQFIATGHYSDGSTANISTTVNWNSSNTAIASINAAGVATSKATGSTTISASLGSLSASTSLSVAIRAYTANAGTNSVIVCQVNATNGSLSGCANNLDATFNFPLGVILNIPANFAYIANFLNNTVSICAVDHSTGSFGACVATTGNGTFAGPQRAMLNQDNTFLYIANGSSNTVSICPVINDGAGIGTCTTSNGSGSFVNPQDIIFSADNTFAYVANTNNTISICTMNADGDIDTCTTQSGNGTFNIPFGISFTLDNAFMYVANFGNNTVSICPIIDGGASIGTCTTTTGNGTFNFSGNTETQLWMQTTINFGYVPNSGSNTMSICPIHTSDGTLGTCVTSTGDSLFNLPASVTLR